MRKLIVDHPISNFKDKRGREWECFVDLSYFDLICVRTTHDRDFNSPTSFHFNLHEEAIAFCELLKRSS